MRLAALKPYLLSHRRKLVAGVLSIAGGATVGLLAPLLIGKAVDMLREEISHRALLDYSLMLLAVVLVQGLFTFAQRTLLVSMSRDIEFDCATTTSATSRACRCRSSNEATPAI